MEALLHKHAVSGHNRSPFEISKETITDLYEEAKGWLDGEPVTTQEMADAINTLKSGISIAKKIAEESRETEIKPHQAIVKEIQTRYNELIGENKSVTGLAIKAIDACNAALKPYLLELDRQQKEAARLAREEAERKQQEAMEAMRQRDRANLVEREDAERLVREAKKAEDAARKAENVKAHAKGSGRATGLRTVWKAVMSNERDAAAWVWKEHNAELIEFVQGLADSAVRSGRRSVPGFDVIEEKYL